MNKKIIIPVILLTAALSSCVICSSLWEEPLPAIMGVYLLAETPQPAEILRKDYYSDFEYNLISEPIVINTTKADFSFYSDTFNAPNPTCEWVPLPGQEILPQFPETDKQRYGANLFIYIH